MLTSVVGRRAHLLSCSVVPRRAAAAVAACGTWHGPEARPLSTSPSTPVQPCRGLRPGTGPALTSRLAVSAMGGPAGPLGALRQVHLETDPRRVVKLLDTQLDAYLEELRALVEVNSFTGNPKGVDKVGQMTQDLFDRHGLVTEDLGTATRVKCTDEPRGVSHGSHLFLHKPGHPSPEQEGPTRSVALVAHLDTVFPPKVEARHDFRWREDDKGFIRGPGVVDIKGGTILMAMTMQAVRKLAPELYHKTGFHLWWNAAEEAGVSDFAGACRAQVRPDERIEGVFVHEFDLAAGAGGDSGGIDAMNDEMEEEDVCPDGDVPTFNIVCERKGCFIAHVIILGREAHAGNLHAYGRNAIDAAADLIHHARALTDYDKRLTVNVGTIHGGTAVNTVPGRVDLQLEMRAPSGPVFDEARDKLLQYCADYRHVGLEEQPSPKTMTPIATIDPWQANNWSNGLFSHYEKAAEELGFNVQPQVRGGLSDGNWLWNSFPVVDGCGVRGENPHCAEHRPEHGHFQEVLNSRLMPAKAVLNAVAIISLLQSESVVTGDAPELIH